MILDELKSSGIRNLIEASEYFSRSYRQGLFFIPDTISNIVADIVNPENATNAIVLNSNFGEISSKLKNIKNLVNVDIDSNNIGVAEYLNPTLTFINEDPLNYSSDKYDYVVSIPPMGIARKFHWLGMFERGRCGKMWLSNKLQWNCNAHFSQTTKHSVP